MLLPWLSFALYWPLLPCHREAVYICYRAAHSIPSMPHNRRIEAFGPLLLMLGKVLHPPAFYHLPERIDILAFATLQRQRVDPRWPLPSWPILAKLCAIGENILL